MTAGMWVIVLGAPVILGSAFWFGGWWARQKVEKKLDASEVEAHRANRKSLVRVVVTYGAAAYIFLGAPLLILVNCEADAEGTYQSVLPVAIGIVTYWFAERAREKK